MADVKAIKVNNTTYNIKDNTARTNLNRINLYKSSDGKIHFVNANGTDTVIM